MLDAALARRRTRLARLPAPARTQGPRRHRLGAPRHHRPRPDHDAAGPAGAWNVGIATGPSGLVVVDLDTPKPDEPGPVRRATSSTDLADELGQTRAGHVHRPHRTRRPPPVLHRTRPARRCGTPPDGSAAASTPAPTAATSSPPAAPSTTARTPSSTTARRSPLPDWLAEPATTRPAARRTPRHGRPDRERRRTAGRLPPLAPSTPKPGASEKRCQAVETTRCSSPPSPSASSPPAARSTTEHVRTVLDDAAAVHLGRDGFTAARGRPDRHLRPAPRRQPPPHPARQHGRRMTRNRSHTGVP